eukprot:3120326-Prymnesium_polylepis.2
MSRTSVPPSTGPLAGSIRFTSIPLTVSSTLTKPVASAGASHATVSELYTLPGTVKTPRRHPRYARETPGSASAALSATTVPPSLSVAALSANCCPLPDTCTTSADGTACDGLVHSTRVASTKRGTTNALDCVPNRHRSVASASNWPVMTTGDPPFVGPSTGATAETTGSVK